MKRFLLRAACAALVVCCALSDAQAGPLKRLLAGRRSCDGPAPRRIAEVRAERRGESPSCSTGTVTFRQVASVAVLPVAKFTNGAPAVRAVEIPVTLPSAQAATFDFASEFKSAPASCVDCHKQPQPSSSPPRFFRGRR
jgi:cytochrome c553